MYYNKCPNSYSLISMLKYSNNCIFKFNLNKYSHKNIVNCKYEFFTAIFEQFHV